MRVSSLIIALSVLSTVLVLPTSAQQGKTEVKARVGEYNLNLSGFASRDAAVLLISNNQTLGSTIADSAGKFRFTDLPISRGFSSFCFRQIDYKSIGESSACLTIEPATKDVRLTDIYLPPTIGLERQSITVGSSGLAFGYSMPESKVTMSLSNGARFEEAADEKGYYSFTVGNLPEGSYSLQSRGLYKSLESIKPDTSITLRVLTSSATYTNEGLLLRRQLLSLLPWVLLGILLCSSLIGFVLYKKQPQRLGFLRRSKLFSFLEKRFSRKLHHAWFVGY